MAPSHNDSPAATDLPSALPSDVDWLFLDLDGTLWDHERASNESLLRTCREFHIPYDAFIPRFELANEAAWEQLGEGLTTRERMRVERFRVALEDIDPDLLRRIDVRALSRRYLEIYLEDPVGYWIDGGRELLEAASRAGKHIALLTNGFSDTQFCKVKEAGEADVIDFIWGPEEAGCLKPRRAFFETALARAECPPSRALMIGDSLSSDVLVPLALGLRAWWFNPRGVPAPSGLPAFPVFERLADLLPLFDGSPRR